ncbi:hypothetical protein GQ600_23944 [Phytophthora cactorum]|nr:hypothetical protein GQ600_23944 [Phytophthora cactorum]
MRKYEDTWVVDRTMFEYVNQVSISVSLSSSMLGPINLTDSQLQGGCSCCGVTHTIMNLADFASKCSDWGADNKTSSCLIEDVGTYKGGIVETDDENKEQFSPWPMFIHEEILTERARLRMAMKADMNKYKGFVDAHMKGFINWWSRLGENAKARIFQLPAEEVLSYFRVQTKVKGSYEILLCAILEQIRHFQETGYTDGRVAAELYFEKNLVHQRDSFVLDSQYIANDAGDTNFFEMLKILGGPKLLPVRTTRNPNEKSEAEAEQAKSESNVQSFRSDRRLVRLVRSFYLYSPSLSITHSFFLSLMQVMFRIFADMAMRKYTREVVNAESNNKMDL